MRSKIVYLPLDERPCNYDYPAHLGAIAGIPLLAPPSELMGHFKCAAQTDTLWDWLFANASDATHLVASMDLLIYGGIVPSRLHQLSRATCDERIARMRRLKSEFPHLKLSAFQLITRAPARNGACEEPDYYDAHGYAIYRYGVVTDKEFLGIAGVEELSEKTQILARVPQPFLQDFLDRREINLVSNMHTINLVADGVLDHLIIPLDDCKEYGYAAAERRRLARYLAEKGALSRVAMYPGADEIGCTLVARAVCDITNHSPCVWLDYNSHTGMLTTPSYEDRTIGETAPHHALNGGARLAMLPEACDAVMFLHPPTAFTQRLEKELDRRKIYLECERNLPAFLQRLQWHLKRETPCFIADCAIPNGADKCLMHFLAEQNLLEKISGYSGWNTSSNALGTVMAHAIVLACVRKAGTLTEAQQQASDKFRLYRYLEDWGYMVEVRKTLTERLPAFGEGLSFLSLGDQEPSVAQEATQMLRAFTARFFPHCGFVPCVRMPWSRMFEVSLQLERRL